jgi:hypothetical protein
MARAGSRRGARPCAGNPSTRRAGYIDNVTPNVWRMRWMQSRCFLSESAIDEGPRAPLYRQWRKPSPLGNTAGPLPHSRHRVLPSKAARSLGTVADSSSRGGILAADLGGIHRYVGHHRRLIRMSSESPSSRRATFVSSIFAVVMPPGGSTSTLTVSFSPPPVANRESTFV